MSALSCACMNVRERKQNGDRERQRFGRGERGGERESVIVRGEGENLEKLPCVCRACVVEKEKDRKREGERKEETQKERGCRREKK